MESAQTTGRLTLVGTPIGNLSDFSPRAVEALQACDFIAAEDTRVTLKLLNHFGISKPLVSYFEHNKRERGEVICARLQAGENAVLVTDAGMPAISDPGEDLVALCHKRGIPVGVVPGPTAMATALAVAGLPTGRFTFEGFLSVNRRSRREHLQSLRGEQLHHGVLRGTAQAGRHPAGSAGYPWGSAVALVRELTKLHEEVIRTTLAGAVARYAPESGHSPRGEYVLVVGGAEKPSAPAMTPEQAAALAREYMADGMPAVGGG